MLPLVPRKSCVNVKHPARFLYPTENGGEPGTAFPADARAEAEAFLAYRAFPFETPLRQTLANLASLFGVVFLIGVAAADGWARRRSAVETDAQRKE